MANENDMRTRIIAEGIRLFLRKGYRGAALSELMKKVNISKPAFYWHFRSTDQFLETIIDKFEEFVDSLIARVEHSNEAFIPRFRLIHKLTTDFGYSNKELVLVFVTLAGELTGDGDRIEEKIYGVYKKLVDFYARLIDLGKRDGEVDEAIDSATMARIIVGINGGVLLGWHLDSRHDSFDSRRAAGMSFDVLLSGLLGEPKHKGRQYT